MLVLEVQSLEPATIWHCPNDPQLEFQAAHELLTTPIRQPRPSSTVGTLLKSQGISIGVEA